MSTPHIHATFVPLVRGERKRKKKEEQVSKRYRKKPTDTPRLCADEIMTRNKLKFYQDTYAEAMKRYGLQRGIDGSEAKHVSTREYYRELLCQTGELQIDVQQLKEQQQIAQEELKQIKKEVHTERLKGAATATATNIVESVGSLFGSNKTKTENAQLKQRISELESQAEERKQYIKRMEQEHKTEQSKLTECLDKVKRYFPHVEKLLPLIDYCRNTMHFSDTIH